MFLAVFRCTDSEFAAIFRYLHQKFASKSDTYLPVNYHLAKNGHFYLKNSVFRQKMLLHE